MGRLNDLEYNGNLGIAALNVPFNMSELKHLIN